MKIALYQLSSQTDPEPNMEKINQAARAARQAGAEALFLPECFYSMGDALEPTPHVVTENNQAFKDIQNIAAENRIHLLGGSVAYRDGKTLLNRALNFDPQGKLLSVYDKRNLFSCDFVKNGRRKTIDEARIYKPGNREVLDDIGRFRVGYGICFDLRYPEQSRRLVQQGATVLTYASAFTVPTGKAHWHTLVRARAVENQCFVVAAAQWGANNPSIQTFGHSLVVDPWGEILVDLEEGEKWATVDLDPSLVKSVRSQVKVF